MTLPDRIRGNWPNKYVVGYVDGSIKPLPLGEKPAEETLYYSGKKKFHGFDCWICSKENNSQVSCIKSAFMFVVKYSIFKMILYNISVLFKYPLINVMTMRTIMLIFNYRIKLLLFYSFNNQLIVSPRGKIIWCHLGTPARRHDAVAFPLSFDFSLLDQSHIILGDGGYMGMENVSSPNKKSPGMEALPNEQLRWNKVHAYMRSTVEHVFGDIERRFQIIVRPRFHHFRIQPLITLLVYQLYDFITSRTGGL
jgi:hypothetical protein